MSDRRLLLNDLDPSSDIDLSNVPKTVLELVVETTSAVPRLSMKNIPVDLTLLEFRPLLSSSITEPFYLPITLKSYRGPVLSDMKLPPNLENLALVESASSLQTSDVALPPLLKVMVVENPLKFSNLDSTKLPPSVESFQIIGKFNCSLEKLVFPPSLISLDVGKSTQPVDLLSTRAKIVQETTVVEDTKRAPELELVVTATNSAFKETLGALRKNFPRLDKLHVILDDKVLTSLGDVWTEVLFEGRVQVGELTVTNTVPTNTCLGDCGQVFKRSRHLGRNLCRKLIIVSEKYSHVSHINLAMSLKLIGGISLEVSYADRGPSECLLPRFAEYLGLSKDNSSIAKYVSDSFGAKTTSVQLSEGPNKLVVVVGESPKVYERPKPPQPLVVPVGSIALEQALNPQESKTHQRPIVLYTWKACGFCQKQQEVIDEFKNKNFENKSSFNDKVEVKVLENPHDVPDKRVDSFPTWVKDNNLIVGVQSVEKLTSLLG